MVGEGGGSNSNRRYSIPETEKARVASRDSDSDGTSNSRKPASNRKDDDSNNTDHETVAMATPTAETPQKQHGASKAESTASTKTIGTSGRSTRDATTKRTPVHCKKIDNLFYSVATERWCRYDCR